MNIKKFDTLNILNLPRFRTDAKINSKDLPSHFFLHNSHHIIYVNYYNKIGRMHDSLGQSSSDFVKFFLTRKIKIVCVFWKPIQKKMYSELCAYHAILFSLGYVAHCSEYIFLQYINQCLFDFEKQYTNTINPATCQTFKKLRLREIPTLNKSTLQTTKKASFVSPSAN